MGGKKTLSEMSGLTFPVARVGSALKKGGHAKRVSPTAAVFLTSVLQYCTGELLRVAARAATSGKKKKNRKQHQIKPRHICVAVREDNDLGDLLSKVTIAGGGVGGGVHAALEQDGTRKRRAKKAASDTKKTSKPTKTTKGTKTTKTTTTKQPHKKNAKADAAKKAVAKAEVAKADTPKKVVAKADTPKKVVAKADPPKKVVVAEETNHETSNSLWETLRKIKAAATACGKGDEIVFRDPATDEEIAAVTQWIGRQLPADIEDMLRHSNGVQIRCSGCSDAALAVPSTEDMLEIANYSEHTGAMIRRIGALPWLSVDCDFAYTVLEKRGSEVHVWMIDLECRQVTCSGTFSSILDQLLAFYVGLKAGGATKFELRTASSATQFGRKVKSRLPRDDMW